MNIALVGADLEENLGIGMIAAVAERAGSKVTVVPFNDAQERCSVAAKLVGLRAQVIGLSIQFQHRSSEFVALAKDLRSRGFAGHITAGGQFPTLAWKEVLAGGHGVDSVVLHDGEDSFVELLAALQGGAPLSEIAGLAVIGVDGQPIRTRGRRLVRDLDRFPFPARYREHTRHLGIPFIPIMGGRGCWGRCSYCSITSTYRDARAHGGGPTLRYRSPDNVAEEMAQLLRRAGPRAVFCFHDDNFLLPRPEASIARLSAIRQALDVRVAGGGRIGLIGKCRPDSLTPQLALTLRELGVVRLYLGVENTSEPGLAHLRRGVRGDQIHEALAACRRAGIFVCYNLLLFEPDATLDDIAHNIAFVRDHAEHPINFGRAEPYYGTPLQLGLAADGNLSGDYLGHGYRVKDDRTELLFRICAAVFRQRNYDPDGVHNRTMGVGYTAKLLEHFFADQAGRLEAVAGQAGVLTRRIVLESADLLEEALSLARAADLADQDRIERETALLGLRIARSDRRWHEELDDFFRDVEQFVASQSRTRRIGRAAGAAAKRAAQLLQGVALASLLAAGVDGCDRRPNAIDPDVGPLDGRRPRDFGDADPGPLDHWMVVDPDVAPLDHRPPRDAGVERKPTLDQKRPRDAGVEHMIVDPPPPPDGKIPHARLIDGLLDKWRDTAARQITRTADLPLFDPPALQLSAVRQADSTIQVSLIDAGCAISTRWESDGEIVGSGSVVRWIPADENDQICVGVRTGGGVAVAALRARDVPRG